MTGDKEENKRLHIIFYKAFDSKKISKIAIFLSSPLKRMKSINVGENLKLDLWVYSESARNQEKKII